MPWRYKLIDREDKQHINTISIRDEDGMEEMTDIADLLGCDLEFDRYEWRES